MRILVLCSLLLAGCTAEGRAILAEQQASPIAGAKTAPFDVAHHECFAYSREDITKSYHHRYVYCMAQKGWKVGPKGT